MKQKTDDRDFSESERQAFKAHGRLAVKAAAQRVMGTDPWARLVELHESGARFTSRVGICCVQCGQPVVDVLVLTPLSDYTVGLITHAMHTNDGGEIIRLITRLSEKGRM